MSRRLAFRFRVTGVDISDVQIARARTLVPAATFVRRDITALRFPAESFEAVVFLYALIHVPIAEQLPLLSRIHAWLAPGGRLLATVGHEAFEGVESEWMGSARSMYWSHADFETYRRWLRSCGFEILRSRFIPEGGGGHELVVARKSFSRDAGSSSRLEVPAAPHPNRGSGRPRFARKSESPAARFLSSDRRIDFPLGTRRGGGSGRNRAR